MPEKSISNEEKRCAIELRKGSGFIQNLRASEDIGSIPQADSRACLQEPFFSCLEAESWNQKEEHNQRGLVLENGGNATKY